jgi:hypothetical protein
MSENNRILGVDFGKKRVGIAISDENGVLATPISILVNDKKLVKYFVEFIRDGYFDVMLGSRIRTRKEALDGGMPIYKYYANRFLTFIQNIVSGQSLSEWHTGMRAYSREVLESLNYEKFSDDFVFDTQVLFSIVRLGYTIGDIPVPVRYFKEASSINFKRSVKYGLQTLFETFKFVAGKIF